MLMPYKPEAFYELNEFRLAKEGLQGNQEKLTQLGEVICRYNLNQVLGVSLLHKHFELQPNEKLVEDFFGKSACIKPCNEKNSANVAPYLWKFSHDKKTGKRGYFPLEFARIGDEIAQLKKLAESTMNDSFLSEMATKLSELELENTFGLSLLHRDTIIGFADGEILIETTDYDRRTLNISSVPESEVSPVMLTPTLWSFTTPDSSKVAGECYMHCINHCRSHCINHN